MRDSTTLANRLQGADWLSSPVTFHPVRVPLATWIPPRQVLEMIARAADCSLALDPRVTGPVTLRVSRITARTALTVVCESVGCRWRLDGSVLRVDVEAEPAPAAGRVKPPVPKPVASLPSGEPVYEMGEGVTLPKAVREVRPQYTRAAREAKTQGEVVLDFVVLKDGTVGEVRVTRSLSPDLDEQAVEAVSQWLFTPGSVDGRPVAVRVQAEMVFSCR